MFAKKKRQYRRRHRVVTKQLQDIKNLETRPSEQLNVDQRAKMARKGELEAEAGVLERLTGFFLHLAHARRENEDASQRRQAPVQESTPVERTFPAVENSSEHADTSSQPQPPIGRRARWIAYWQKIRGFLLSIWEG